MNIFGCDGGVWYRRCLLDQCCIYGNRYLSILILIVKMKDHGVFLFYIHHFEMKRKKEFPV